MKLSQTKWIVAFLVMFAAAAAWAFPNFVKVFADTYKVDANSNLAKAGCSVCHTSKTIGGKLNPYGLDLQKALKAENTTTLTAAILAKVEKLDSDKDGATNIQEIKANCLPGDPKSTPKKD